MKKIKNPWPTKDVMTQIYERNLWGGGTSSFYSGEGSHRLEIIEPYIKNVQEFLKSFEDKLTILDLGCGDFNIGKELVSYAKEYIAVDIVGELVEYNKKIFNAKNLSFHCLNISKDELPKADCVILRQVLQHLSNLEIQKIIKKLQNYQYIILTEHIPEGDFIPNVDIISGQGIRLKKKSGVDVLASPFNLSIKSKKELHSFSLEGGKGIIKTILYTIY